MSGIGAVGAYVPRFRITADTIADARGSFEARGINEKAVPAADEDALTMAYEAATRALQGGGFEGADIDWLGFGTSTPPVAEEDVTVHLRAMLGIPAGAKTRAFSGSTRAGTTAIHAAIDAIEAGKALAALVVAADSPRGPPDHAIEHAAGAGAAAFLVTPDGAGRVIDRAEYSTPYPGTRFRQRGSVETTGLEITAYNRRAFVEPIEGAVAGLPDHPAADVVAMHAPDGDLPYRAADAVGIDRELVQSIATVHELGDLGAASVPVTLAIALSDGHQTILAIGHGSGASADAMRIEVAPDATVSTNLFLSVEDHLSYHQYLTRRGVLSAGEPAGGGAYISVPAWRRSLPQRYRLVAGQCVSCGAVAFPPNGVCHECNGRNGYDRFELPGTGTVETVTTIAAGGAPPEFVTLQERAGAYTSVVAAFDVGDEAVSAPAMATQIESGSLEVGDRVEVTVRRVYTQEGVTRYGFKVRSADT